jgi:hypothetical protein
MDTVTVTTKSTDKISASIYETPCKTCVFARYNGDTQVGCAFDRVEKFRKQGVEVLEVYDDDKEFYVIKNICRAHRDKKSPWAMKHAGPTRKEICRQELRLDVDVIIVLDGNHTVDEVKITIDSLLAQTFLPANVTVVLNKDGVDVKDVQAVLPADWLVKVIAERRAGERVGRGRCIDLSLVNSKSHFYALFNPGFVVPPTFIEDVDIAINDELERFVLLEPNQAGEGCVIQMRAHSYYGGNSEALVEGEDAGEDLGKRADSIIDKILHRVKIEEKTHLVKNVTDICRGMS